MEAIALQTKEATGGNVYQILQDFDAPASVKKELEAIFAPANDKPLLLDLWMEGCVPCYQGFPKVEEAHTQLAGEVAFAYLAGDTGKESWQKISAEKGLTGPNYLLSPDAQLFFQAYFGLFGYPYYIFIQKGGDIVYKRNWFGGHVGLKKDFMNRP